MGKGAIGDQAVKRQNAPPLRRQVDKVASVEDLAEHAQMEYEARIKKAYEKIKHELGASDELLPDGEDGQVGAPTHAPSLVESKQLLNKIIISELLSRKVISQQDIPPGLIEEIGKIVEAVAERRAKELNEMKGYELRGSGQGEKGGTGRNPMNDLLSIEDSQQRGGKTNPIEQLSVELPVRKGNAQPAVRGSDGRLQTMEENVSAPEDVLPQVASPPDIVRALNDQNLSRVRNLVRLPLSKMTEKDKEVLLADIYQQVRSKESLQGPIMEMMMEIAFPEMKAELMALQKAEPVLDENGQVLSAPMTLIDFKTLSMQEFGRLFRKILESHVKCGDFCPHLKRFYARLGLFRQSSSKEVYHLTVPSVPKIPKKRVIVPVEMFATITGTYTRFPNTALTSGSQTQRDSSDQHHIRGGSIG
jgi:hypothetical protein